ncbi:MAG: serine/threonine protein kinase [Bdellovibrionales bacterium]|nr:serine/threonine protein kinase [Bdellovibrionales bacterium]
MERSPWGEEQTRFFFELTPERVLAAVEAAGFVCTGRCFALNSFENRVYDIELDLGEMEGSPLLASLPPKGRNVVVKFYRPGRWSKEQILEEHEFLLELQAQEIPVVAPLRFPGGETLREVFGIWSAVFPRVGGRSPAADELGAERLEQVGRLLARIHNVGSVHPARHRIRIDPASYGLSNLRYLIDRKSLPPEYVARYRHAVERICELSQPWFTAAEGQYQRIHGDCHFGNLLWSDRGACFLDFDDMVTGPPVQDLWLLVPGRDPAARRDFESMLGGYSQMRAFDRGTLRLIEPLRALRFVHFTAWIARRWEDPAFPRAFPQYGGDRYWMEQTADLEEQLRIVEAGGGVPPPPVDETPAFGWEWEKD